MNIKTLMRTAAATTAAVTIYSQRAEAQTGTDLLENGGFEYMVGGLSNGTNTSTTPPAGWTVSAGETDLQQGPATGTNAGAPLNPYNGAYSGAAAVNANGYNSNLDTGGNHFFDGTNNNTGGFTIIYQNFTLTQPTTLTGSFALGARDGANGLIGPGAGQPGTISGNGINIQTSQLQILDISTGSNAVPISYGATNVTTYLGDTSQVTVGNWEVNNFTVKNLAPGTYSFQVSLYDSQNLDAVGLTGPAVVPEPSSLLAAFVGCGFLIASWRLRRRL